MIHALVEQLLGRDSYRVLTACTLESGLEVSLTAEGAKVDVILLDRHLGAEDGLSRLPQVFAAFPDVPVVLVTSSSTIDVAVEAIRRGAFDFIPKPIDEARLFATLNRAVAHRVLLRRVAGIDNPAATDDAFAGIIGASPAMLSAFHILRHVSPTDVSVLITGESGTGKELVARAVHALSSRASGPFVPLNMAALPRELVEATLFGHERGAFTGAERRRDGAVAEAQGGTLFLDEIAEMPLELQSKLLRFLQERVYRPVGGQEDIRADLRIVSATNRDPLGEVSAGRLRADLYYRLAVVPVQLPPLRHRPGDVSLIATYALRQFSAKYGKKFESIDTAALARMTAYPWPGNVRELVHLIERLVVLNEGGVVTDAMLPPEIDAGPAPTGIATPAPASAASPPPPAHLTDHDPLLRPAALINPESSDIVPIAELERRAVEHALRVCQGSAAAAAQKLGMSTATIYRKIKEFGLNTRAMP